MQAWTSEGEGWWITFLPGVPAVGKDKLTLCVWKWARSSQVVHVWDGTMQADWQKVFKCREDTGRPAVPVHSDILSGIHGSTLFPLEGLETEVEFELRSRGPCPNLFAEEAGRRWWKILLQFCLMSWWRQEELP